MSRITARDQDLQTLYFSFYNLIKHGKEYDVFILDFLIKHERILAPKIERIESNQQLIELSHAREQARDRFKRQLRRMPIPGHASVMQNLSAIRQANRGLTNIWATVTVVVMTMAGITVNQVIEKRSLVRQLQQQMWHDDEAYQQLFDIRMDYLLYIKMSLSVVAILSMMVAVSLMNFFRRPCFHDFPTSLFINSDEMQHLLDELCDTLEQPRQQINQFATIRDFFAFLNRCDEKIARESPTQIIARHRSSSERLFNYLTRYTQSRLPNHVSDKQAFEQGIETLTTIENNLS